MKKSTQEVTSRRTRSTTKPETYPDPSGGRACGPVCCLSFPAPFEVGALVYGNRQVRTYSPGKVDPRYLPLKPVFCDDQVQICTALCEGRRGHFVVPVSLAKDVLGNTFKFAKADRYPEW